MELYKILFLLGFVLITLGIILYFIENRKNIEIGGVIFLGPIPIPFGNVPMMVVLILWFIYLLFIFIFLALNHKTF